VTHDGEIWPVPSGVQHTGQECVRFDLAMQRDSDSPSPNPKPDSPRESGSNDVVLIHGRSPDGKGLSVIRQRNDRLEQGFVMPLEHGKPIHGEVVTLRPRPEFPLLCDVNVECSSPTAAAEVTGDCRAIAKGPGQVATDQYRTNWDRIFDHSISSRKDLN